MGDLLVAEAVAAREVEQRVVLAGLVAAQLADHVAACDGHGKLFRGHRRGRGQERRRCQEDEPACGHVPMDRPAGARVPHQ